VLGMRLKLMWGQFIFLPAMFASVRTVYASHVKCKELIWLTEPVRYECGYTRVESGLALVSALRWRMCNTHCAGVGGF
jgi:hypothetical protein